ncbi:RNA polymerase II C-terminal domain phosphatase-like 4 [Vitis vinifera]|uniref:Translation initiation factor eIF2B subunit gamma n=1 Tax=Vitis vinifera TaxID=29760 RepID=A0A438CFP2_VITVI|nr:RNA polymerase II C-terminal domain phosphatase-like 4 [Vitis vinifera]
MERYHFFASSCRQFGFNCKSLSELKSDESEPDGALATVLKVLQRIHSMFFDPELGDDFSGRDVRQVVKRVRKDVLKGCKIVFSRVFPTRFQAENHHLWRMAEQLGATCATELDPSVTHVVSTDAGTEKSRWALQEKKFLVAAVPEDVGTAGALRAIAHHLTANDILVVSGDLVCDVSPGAVAAAHRRHGAAVTAMLCSVPVSGPLESGSSSGKDKTKKPGCCNIIGLDPTKQFLLYIATGPEIERDIRVQKSILRAVGQMEIRADLMDAHLYAFKRAVLQEVLDQKDAFQSLQQDVLPYLVRSQLRSELSLNGAPHTEENGHDKVVPGINQVMLSQLLAKTSTPSFHELYAMGPNGSAPVRRTHKCCVYIASQDKYCARLNSIQAFSDINRDVIGEASHLSGYSFSAQNNIIHPSAELGSKTTVGQNCMLGEGSQLGDKCSVKRSVIGRHCRIGSNVKVVNSVVMNHVTISDGCSIQGSVICSNAQLQERVVLKDCQGSLSLLAANTRASSWQKKRDNNLNYVLTTWSSHCASFQILDRVLMVGFDEGSLMMTLYEQDYEKEDSWRIEKFWTPCYLPRGISE